MKNTSTRGETPPHSFSEAVAAGLAPDGGLFLPDPLPYFGGIPEGWEGLSYAELAAQFFEPFAPEIPIEEWRALTAQAYGTFSHADVAPLVALSPTLSVLELFHGPTLAFKDFALQLLGLLYKRQVKQTGHRLAVLGATSGDTGSAAIHGCLGQDGITIFILYPQGRVAPLQERQMACTGAANVHAMPIEGTFDDAQALVKEVFADAKFANSVHLSAVNSINIARILAQCVYYLWAYLKSPADQRATMEFIVPTGNFGNVLAGWLAQKMGLLPATIRFRVATNQNDILHRFFTTGHYQRGEVRPSHAPSMDIQAASNFERFVYFLKDQYAGAVRYTMRKLQAGEAVDMALPGTTFSASRMDDAEILRTIKSVHKTFGYVVDPHTACAFQDLSPKRLSVVLATASPAKFPDTVKEAIGQEPTDPSLEALKSKPLETHPIEATAQALKDYVRKAMEAP